MNFEQHASELVEHYIWMRLLEPTYARWSLENFMANPERSVRDLDQQVAAEWARQLNVHRETLHGPPRPRSPKGEAAPPSPEKKPKRSSANEAPARRTTRAPSS